MAGDRGSRRGCPRRRDVASGGGKQAASCGQAVRYALECASVLARRPDGELEPAARGQPPARAGRREYVRGDLLAATTAARADADRSGSYKHRCPVARHIQCCDRRARDLCSRRWSDFTRAWLSNGWVSGGHPFRMTGTDKWAVVWQPADRRVSAVRFDRRPPPLHRRRGHLERHT